MYGIDRDLQQEGYAFNGDPFEVFEIFFGTSNPHAIALDEAGKQVKMIEKIESDLHKDAVTERKDTHAADLNINWACTLLEFFYGSTKLIAYKRLVTQGDGQTTEYTMVEKEIEIKPGMKPGTVLRFVGEGNQPANQLPGDLLVTIEQEEHPTIRRVGDDLIYRHKISLADALTIAACDFQTLDNETIKFRPDEIITPQFKKVFHGKGMPIYNDDPLSPLMMNHTRGNFILTFQIEFPKQLTSQQKQVVGSILEPAQ
jgi:DnaJ-class molecular chaperone